MVHADVGAKSAITPLAFEAYNTRRRKTVTPEERFAKIESILQATVEKHVLLQEQQERQQAQLGAFGQEIEKQNDGIRSLIVVARTCLDSIKEMRERHDADYQKLLESQAITDEKLHILIDTVDRVIRRESKSQ